MWKQLPLAAFSSPLLAWAVSLAKGLDLANSGLQKHLSRGTKVPSALNSTSSVGHRLDPSVEEADAIVNSPRECPMLSSNTVGAWEGFYLDGVGDVSH